MAAIGAAHAAAHAERAGAHQALEQEVLALFDSRVTAVGGLAPSGGSADTILAEKEALQKRLTELERLQKAALQTAAFDAAFEDLSLASLPPAKVPVGSDLATQAHAYHLLSAWTQSGANTQFTFQQLADHGQLGDEVVPLMTAILGDVWTRWFAEPTPERIVPRQVALLLHQGLDRVRAAWEADSAIRGQAASAYAVLCGEAKRCRVAPY